MCIADTVGLKQKNAPDDVEIVNRLLNYWLDRRKQDRLPVDRTLKAASLNRLSLFVQENTPAVPAAPVVPPLGKLAALVAPKIGASPPPQPKFAAPSTAPVAIAPGDRYVKAFLDYVPVVTSPDDLTEEHLGLIWPEASGKSIHRYAPPLKRTMKEFEINTPVRMAHFLAQVGVESLKLAWTSEVPKGDAETYFARYEREGNDRGNTAKGDGKLFRGRGLIQITGRYNYEKFESYLSESNKTKYDFTSSEEKANAIANDDNLACTASGWFWKTKKLNAVAERGTVRDVSVIVNGGTNGLDERKALFKRANYVICRVV